MFATFHFCRYQSWSEQDLLKLSSVKQLHLMGLEGFQDAAESLHQVLRACRSSLTSLSFDELWEALPLQFDLPILSSLELGTEGEYNDMFTRPLPSLKSISSIPKILDSLTFLKNMQTIGFVIEREDYYDELNYRVESLEIMEKLVKESSPTLVTIKLKKGAVGGTFDVKPFLQSLKVGHLFPSSLCPHLSNLYVSLGQQFDVNILVELMISRNFAAKGWKLDGEGADEERSCSELTLHLEACHLEGFKVAEEEILSRCSRLVRDRAGRTEVREWVGETW